MRRKDGFIDWLTENTVLSLNTIKKYAGAVNTISKGLKEKGLLEGSLYYINDPVIVKKYAIKYFSIIEFREKDERGNKMYSNATKYYVEYCKSID